MAALDVTILLHLVSAIVLRYILYRSRGPLAHIQFRTLLVLNVLQLAFNPLVLTLLKGREEPWAVFVGYPVLALVLGVAAVVKHGYADRFTTPLQTLTRRLLNTSNSTLGSSRPAHRRSSPRGRRSTHKRSSSKAATCAAFFSVLGLVARMILVILRRLVTCAFPAVKLLAPMAFGLLATVVTTFKTMAISSIHVATSLVRMAYNHAPSITAKSITGFWSIPASSCDGSPASVTYNVIALRSGFFDKWVLLDMSSRVQFGAWVAVERVWYRPSTGILTETWLILIHRMGFKCDLNSVYSIWCGNTHFPGPWFVVPFANCHPFVVNEDALPERFIQRFGSLWSVTRLNFVAALEVLKFSDPRLALVSVGRRPVTARFVARLGQYISRQFKQLAHEDVSSLLTVRLPSRGMSKMSIKPTLATLMDEFVYDAALDISSIMPESKIPVGGTQDLASVDMFVKLPGTSVLDVPAHLEQDDGYRGTVESRCEVNAETQMILRVSRGNLTDITEASPKFFEPNEDADVLEAELIEQSVIVYSDSWLINDFYIHRNIVVPAAQWEIGDPIIYGTRIETYSVPLFVAGFEPDWEGVYWTVLGNPAYPEEYVINPVPFEVSRAPVNEEALFENWILRFSGLWSSYFLSTLSVVAGSHPRFALVSRGRRTASSRFLPRLFKFIAQWLEQVKVHRELDVDSTVPIIKLPSRGESRLALPFAISAFADDIACEDGLVTTSVDCELPTIEVPFISVTVKLPGVNALAAPTQRYEGLYRGEETREQPGNTATAYSITIENKENVPTASSNAETGDIKGPRVGVTTNGMRLFKNTLRNALSHNDRAPVRRR